MDAHHIHSLCRPRLERVLDIVERDQGSSPVGDGDAGIQLLDFPVGRNQQRSVFPPARFAAPEALQVRFIPDFHARHDIAVTSDDGSNIVQEFRQVFPGGSRPLHIVSQDRQNPNTVPARHDGKGIHFVEIPDAGSRFQRVPVKIEADMVDPRRFHLFQFFGSAVVFPALQVRACSIGGIRGKAEARQQHDAG